MILLAAIACFGFPLGADRLQDYWLRSKLAAFLAPNAPFPPERLARQYRQALALLAAA
jgi:hypothetical protein